MPYANASTRIQRYITVTDASGAVTITIDADNGVALPLLLALTATTRQAVAGNDVIDLLGDAAGARSKSILDSTQAQVWRIDSLGDMRTSPRRALAEITDPGNGGAIPVTKSGIVNLTTAGAETRTLANPPTYGMRMILGFASDGGDCVITAAAGVNQAGNTSLTFADTGDILVLESINTSGGTRWRVVANDGVALA